MNLYDVYTLFDIEPVKGRGCYVYDREEEKYLDFYGGHAVISIGHSHPHYIRRISEQIKKIAFYSNSVVNSLQNDLAALLEKVSGVRNYDLFLVNSGAEANENALKLASFYMGRKKMLALKNSFHGRTSAAINVTHTGQRFQAAINAGIEVRYFSVFDDEGIVKALSSGEYAGIIIEAIQGVGGLDIINDASLRAIKVACEDSESILILDEIQCGYGRSGDFFAFQQSGVLPDIITMAKGMGNGFPIGGVLINNKKIKPVKGQLGTTYGGNFLACAAALGVLEVFQSEQVITNVNTIASYLRQSVISLEKVKTIKGRGLMMGVEFDFPIAELRKTLVYQHKIFTGNAANPNLIRLLPPLTVTKKEVDLFCHRLSKALAHDY